MKKKTRLARLNSNEDVIVIVSSYCESRLGYKIGYGAECPKRLCSRCSQRYSCNTASPILDMIVTLIPTEREFNKLVGRYRIRRKRKFRWNFKLKWFVAFTDYIQWS
jgi:hypothetical protein